VTEYLAPTSSPLPESIMASGMVAVWDVAARKQELTLQGQTGAILDAAFSPDGTP
jgi:hypothetical protein